MQKTNSILEKTKQYKEHHIADKTSLEQELLLGSNKLTEANKTHTPSADELKAATLRLWSDIALLATDNNTTTVTAANLQIARDELADAEKSLRSCKDTKLYLERVACEAKETEVKKELAICESELKSESDKIAHLTTEIANEEKLQINRQSVLSKVDKDDIDIDTMRMLIDQIDDGVSYGDSNSASWSELAVNGVVGRLKKTKNKKYLDEKVETPDSFVKRVKINLTTEEKFAASLQPQYRDDRVKGTKAAAYASVLPSESLHHNRPTFPSTNAKANSRTDIFIETRFALGVLGVWLNHPGDGTTEQLKVIRDGRVAHIKGEITEYAPQIVVVWLGANVKMKTAEELKKKVSKDKKQPSWEVLNTAGDKLNMLK